VSRVILSCTFALFAVPLGLWADEPPKTAATRKVIQATKIDVEFDDEQLRAICDDLQEKVPGLKITLDSKGGVSQNAKLTFKAKGKTVAEILNGLCDKGGDLGWYVIANEKDERYGWVRITKGKERGYEKGKEPK
jgi:hypothetical protein